jgi:hypothetical protein
MDDGFIGAQIQKLWHAREGEHARTHTDPGETYFITLIEKFGARWRAAWNYSMCKKCECRRICGDKMTRKCKHPIYKKRGFEGSGVIG